MASAGSPCEKTTPFSSYSTNVLPPLVLLRKTFRSNAGFGFPFFFIRSLRLRNRAKGHPTLAGNSPRLAGRPILPRSLTFLGRNQAGSEQQARFAINSSVTAPGNARDWSFSPGPPYGTLASAPSEQF